MSVRSKSARLGLDAPQEYWSIDEATLNMIAGGCGPGTFGDKLVPDAIWGLSITPACEVHDFMYARGKTSADREVADHVFLENMLRIIDRESANWFMRTIRRWRAMTYYSAVREGGGQFFKESTI